MINEPTRWCISTTSSLHLDQKCSLSSGGKGEDNIYELNNVASAKKANNCPDTFFFHPGTWPDCRWSSLSASSSTHSCPSSLTVDTLRLSLWCVLSSCCYFNSSMCRRCVQMPSHSSCSLQTFTSLPMLRSNKSPRTELKQGRMYRLYLYSIRYIEAFQIISVLCNGESIFNGIIATTLFSIKIKKWNRYLGSFVWCFLWVTLLSLQFVVDHQLF